MDSVVVDEIAELFTQKNGALESGIRGNQQTVVVDMRILG